MARRRRRVSCGLLICIVALRQPSIASEYPRQSRKPFDSSWDVRLKTSRRRGKTSSRICKSTDCKCRSRRRIPIGISMPEALPRCLAAARIAALLQRLLAVLARPVKTTPGAPVQAEAAPAAAAAAAGRVVVPLQAATSRRRRHTGWHEHRGRRKAVPQAVLRPCPTDLIPMRARSSFSSSSGTPMLRLSLRQRYTSV